jgi:hypothetical protein
MKIRADALFKEAEAGKSTELFKEAIGGYNNVIKVPSLSHHYSSRYPPPRTTTHQGTLPLAPLPLLLLLL